VKDTYSVMTDPNESKKTCRGTNAMMVMMVMMVKLYRLADEMLLRCLLKCLQTEVYRWVSIFVGGYTMSGC
jgi:hypothetical protein